MGTNYYAVVGPCDSCGCHEHRVHIGKSSAGWCFSLRHDQPNGLVSWKDWRKWLKGKTIVDEYGSPVTLRGLTEIVTKRSGNVGKGTPPRGFMTWRGYASLTHGSVDEKHGLLRHLGDNTVYWAEGPWDLIRGEFC